MKHILLSLVTRALNCVLLGDLSIELSGIFKTPKPIYLPFFSKYLKFVFFYIVYILSYTEIGTFVLRRIIITRNYEKPLLFFSCIS